MCMLLVITSKSNNLETEILFGLRSNIMASRDIQVHMHTVTDHMTVNQLDRENYYLSCSFAC